MLARFEEGQSADPTENMSPEDAKKWREMNEEHRDNFKSAGWAEEKQWLQEARRTPPEKVTPQRAREIMTKAQGISKGPWSDQLSRVMTKGEYRYILDIWDTMPGNTSFMSAFYKVLGSRQSSLDAAIGRLARFEEGVSADPTENMSPEDAEKWREMNEEYGDKFKEASLREDSVENGMQAQTSGNVSLAESLEAMSQMAEGCPDNLDESECREWEANTDKYEDKFKSAAKLIKVPKAPPGKVVVDVSTAPNFDFPPDSDRAQVPLVTAYAVAEDLVQARKIFLSSIGHLGSGNVRGGRVYDDEGKAVAHVSYNGRVWEVDAQGKPTFNEIMVSRVASLDETLAEMRRVAGLATFEQVKSAILDHLRDSGWTVVSSLKIPHATNRDKTVRLWFKAQAVYIDQDSSGKGQFDFKNARSVHIPDLRRESPESFLKHIENWTKTASPFRQRLTSGSKKAAGEYVNLWAAVEDQKLLGVTDTASGKSPSFWKSRGYSPTIVPLKHVPLDLAERLADVGTFASWYDEAEAWKIAQQYAPPSLRKVVQTKEAAPASGLYGFAKTIQADCEIATRKLQKMAAKLAADVHGKDPDVAAFLKVHMKRANSLPAKILHAHLEQAAAPSQKVAGDARKPLDALKDPRGFLAYVDGAQHPETALLPDDVEFVDQTPDQKGFTFRAGSLEQAQKVGRLGGFEVSQVASDIFVARRFMAERKDFTRVGDVREARDWGLYGFKRKTANLGLGACSNLRESAGQIAAALHRRKHGSHEKITGFLGEHAKQAKCLYSKLLRAGYPEADLKLASQPPAAAVSDWLAFED